MANISDLRFDDKNFNQHTQRGMGLLEKSLQKFGAGRSTGLTDKNGKEIYEGDIIQETIMADDRTDGTYRYEVYWDEDTLCWSIKGISDIDYHLRDDLWETNASREVIGNIHEKDKLVDFDHVKGGEE